MRSSILLVIRLTSLIFCVTPVVAQPPATPQSILISALAALGATNTQSTNLSGSSEFIAGSTDETGTFNASCSVNGSSHLQLQLGSSSRTEDRLVTSGTPTGTWLDAAGQQHAMAGHNVLTTESWFCPHLALSRFVLNSKLSVEFIGKETKDGDTVAHLVVSQPAIDSSKLSDTLPRLSKTDIFLDFQTLRPVALDYNSHADKDDNIDIPIEIRFSNYTNTSGVWIPFRIEKYVNSTLQLTLQLQSASAL